MWCKSECKWICHSMHNKSNGYQCAHLEGANLHVLYHQCLPSTSSWCTTNWPTAALVFFCTVEQESLAALCHSPNCWNYTQFSCSGAILCCCSVYPCVSTLLTLLKPASFYCADHEPRIRWTRGTVSKEKALVTEEKVWWHKDFGGMSESLNSCRVKHARFLPILLVLLLQQILFHLPLPQRIPLSIGKWICHSMHNNSDQCAHLEAGFYLG